MTESDRKLGTLERVELRTIWESEAGQFTPWLGRPENLKILGETIGLDLELESQEKEVGPFRADLLCRDTTTGAWVLIENQLERTDHTHLGQLLTYAAGLEAVTIVWVAARFSDEHRAALDWLNERTDDTITFFGLEIELWQIGDSPVAPKFNLVSKPNDWTRSVQRAATSELTESKQIQFEFWTAFRAYMETKSKIPCPKPYPQNWMNHPLGRTGIRLASIASMWNSETNTYGTREMRVELVLDSSRSKQHFSALAERKSEVEASLGTQLTWYNPEETKASRIYERIDADFRDSTQWPKQHEWLRSRLEAFNKTFRPMIDQLPR